MYPNIHYDETNDLAYITFSDKTIANSIESENELLVFDVDNHEELVGIEILSVTGLLHKSSVMQFPTEHFSPEMIPAFIIPQIYRYNRKQILRDGVCNPVRHV